MRGWLRPNGLVLLGYAAIAFGYFGVHLAAHPVRLGAGAPNGANDSDIFIWSFAWWPHAILHGLNPFFSRVIYAPTGTNLAQVTSVPALAIVFSPLTLAFGPMVAFNVAAIALPAISAWCGYLLCRYLTGSLWASVVGGYLFGFSSFEISHERVGQLNQIAAFVVPLVALVVVRHLRGELGPRGLAWRLGCLVAFQAYTSTETALTLTLVLALGLVLAVVLVRDARPRIRAALRPILGGYVLAGALATPLVYYAVTGFNHATVYANEFKIDLLNLVVPTEVNGWGGSTFASLNARLVGGPPERTLYLGLPILLIMGLAGWRLRGRVAVRYLLAAFAVALFLSFGDGLYVLGHRVVRLPWLYMENWSGFSDIAAARISLYAVLAAAVLVAIWIASTKGLVFSRPYALPLLAVAALVPPVWQSNLNVNDPQRLAFFSDKLYETCIPRGETLMIFPFGRWGESTLWQAEAGFWFKIAEGSLGHTNQPASFVSDPIVFSLLMNEETPGAQPTMSQIRTLAARRRVDRIVSDVSGGEGYPTGDQLEAFGKVQYLGNAAIAPACGYESLAGDKRPPPTG